MEPEGVFMPREAHIERQVQWKNKLSEYGLKVNLEKTIYIQNAPVIVDVFAELEGKTFLIEIGDIEDKRKKALMELYAEQNRDIDFIHEPYNTDKISMVLENVTSYLISPEYHQIQMAKEKARITKEKTEKQKSTVYLFIIIIFIVGFIYFNEIHLIWAVVWMSIWLAGVIIWGSIRSAIG